MLTLVPHRCHHRRHTHTRARARVPPPPPTPVPQDAVGTAVCGEGIPMWYSQATFPHLIGKPIIGPSSKLTGTCSVTVRRGSEHCNPLAHTTRTHNTHTALQTHTFDRRP